MTIFYPGQRWISETEADLGIGTILELDHRTVTVLFRSTMETRRYAQHNAPLARFRLSTGDQVSNREGLEITIESVRTDENHLLTYIGRDTQGKEHVLDEVNINDRFAIHDPASRLLSGHIDDSRWFSLRLMSRQHQGMIWQSPVRGLQGARISLVPHQLFIANQIARQKKSRALIADEVGLGKTIEACLILHRRIIQEQCQRALIIVPESLINQWLLELLRRFTLNFSVFDESRCQDLEYGDGGNPFQQAQRILCSVSLFKTPARLKQAIEAGWDMLIVDEAHHLNWSPEHCSEDYRIIETLSLQIPSILLLTATPEQLGQESHFARLRLLDADRFNDLNHFIDEEQAFEKIADLAESVLALENPADKLLDALARYGIHTDEKRLDEDNTAIAHQLVDLHGTSRLLFRNTRKNVSGFPQRNLLIYPLSPVIGNETDKTDTWPDFENAIYDQLADQDPRIDWLSDTIRKLRPEKLLLICSRSQTVLQLEKILFKKQGIRCAVFHEGLTIIERDRAAAWFAEERGADILLCSEIGSEGRNFQFSHHLIVFDLPLNPDLLEQRIGRLDRIGQRHEVNIHVPCIESSAQEKLLDWYQRVTQIFQHPDSVAGAIYEQYGSKLLQTLSASESAWEAMIQQALASADELSNTMQKGRQRLLSLSSFDTQQAAHLVTQIRALDKDHTLVSFMEQVFDIFGIESEHHSKQREVIRPGDHMIDGHFPHLAPDGAIITFDRDTALAHEDTEFITWDHPMVTSAIDTISSGEFGNSGLSVIHHDTLPAGTSLLECLYQVDCPAPAHLPVKQYLAEHTVRLLLDIHGHNLAEKMPHDTLCKVAVQVEKSVAIRAIKAQARQIKALISTSKDMAKNRLKHIRTRSLHRMNQSLHDEIQRLEVLKARNTNITEQDIESLEYQLSAMTELIGKATIHLDAIRLIVVSD